MHGGVAEAPHLLVEHRYRRRTTGHIERCDEVADQRSRHDSTGWFEQSADNIIHQIKLRKRRRAEAVDQQDSLATRALAEIGSDGVDHLRRYLGSRPEFYAAASRLAVDTHTDLHLVLGDVEGRLAGRRNRAARQRDADRARRRIDAIAQELQSGKVASLFCGSA